MDWVILVWLCVAVFAVAIVLGRKAVYSEPAPSHAVTIGPGYVQVWATAARVHMKFRNGVCVLFDRRAAPALGSWLAELHGGANAARLTDGEKSALRDAINAYASDDGNAECEQIAVALSGLLERMK